MNNLMSNFSGLAMSRVEMKKVKGGQTWHCQCNGVGTWTGNYSSSTGAGNAISKYCSGGGSCHTAPSKKKKKGGGYSYT